MYTTPTSGFASILQRVRHSLTWVLATALLAGAMTILLSNRSAASTEFFVLGSEGFADSYPTEVVAGEPVAIRLGITNREGETVSYLVGAYSSTTPLASLEPISIDSGETWTGVVDLTLSSPGLDQEVRIELRTAGGEKAYRSLRLWIDVLEPRQG